MKLKMDHEREAEVRTLAVGILFVFVGVLAVLLFLGGCGPSDDTMSKRFGNEQAHIVTDEQGHKYVVKHHIGNVYVVYPLDEEKEQS